MPGELVSLPVSLPGRFGLNTEEASAVLSPDWATTANNCVFDDSGRIAARKGWVKTNTNALASATVKAVVEHNNAAGTKTIIFAAGNKLYTKGATPTEITGTVTTPTDDNWKLLNFNSKCVGYQDGHAPIVRSSGNFADISVTHGGSIPTTWSGVAAAAYGRVWVMDSSKTVLKISALLDETDFDASSPTATSANFIDLKKVWKGGVDEITAIEAFNGQLVLFGRNSILIYDGVFDPTSMALVENVSGIGCIARDSVAAIGEDMWFLSSSGVRSLSRTIIQDKMPISDISKNVRGYIQRYTKDAATPVEIKAAYSELDGFYLLSVPESSRVFVFDVRGQLEGGAHRVTTWTDNVPTALCYASDATLYLGQPSYLGTYTGYQDNTATYELDFKTAWFKMTQEQVYLIMKKMKLSIYTGATNTVRIKWSFDFSDIEKTFQKTIVGDAIAEFGVAEFGIGEYSGGGGLRVINVPMKGYGTMFRFGFYSVVNNAELAFQKLDIFSKVGRLN